MTGNCLRSLCVVGCVLWFCAPAAAAALKAAPEPVNFNRDVRPILSDHCYTCHGPDPARRKAGLRLDRREDSFRELRSGARAVVAGSRTESELYRRLTAPDEHERMPPARTGKTLSPAQIETLGRWIDQGAPWEEHWSYVAPRRPALPNVKDASWPRNAIDYFILHRLEQEGLTPSPEADRAALIRRLSFDLTGLPPAPAEVAAFLADPSPDAYEKVVDRLLASPHYGERMAQQWLDLARYADTNGYRLDNHRDMWQYRDWVIAAFNENKPFDEFTREQLAGDLLPGATLAQKIASGFNRNTMVNFGNGSDPKEYLAKAVMDRVATTATVWLGTTLACCQCHDHKYDPFTQRDYYRFYAFFNNVPEKGLDGAKGNPVPVVLTPSPEQAGRLSELRRQIADLDALLKSAKAQRVRKDDCRGESIERECEQLRKAETRLLESIPSAMVMEEMPRPRVTRMMIRGDYLAEGEVVTPGVPGSLPPLPPGAPPNRLGLAQWLTDRGNPLTARVAMNRSWQTFFGAGLVRTVDDFGAQGEAPSHLELLDWLAVEFVQRWDLKAMQKLIVMSAAYRQSARVSKALLEKDPQNRLLARAPRFRLDAEMIRDNALAVSGLLNPQVGGPSVRPYQPAGLWEQVAVGGDYTSQTYVPSRGRDLYRRGLYTYWKRSLAHPSLVAFDAPNRELCTPLRPRTNTPLQALVLMNDPTYVEAARVLGERILKEGGTGVTGRLNHAFALTTGRQPTPRELSVLTRVYEQQRQNYREDPKAAQELIQVGDTKPAPGLDVPTLAAWTAVANVLLNLDETISR